MKQQYTLADVHTYTQDVLDVQRELRMNISSMDDESIKYIETQLHVMREVVLRMHESLEKHGARRASLLARWLAAREIRKAAVTLRPSVAQAEILARTGETPMTLSREQRARVFSVKERTKQP